MWRTSRCQRRRETRVCALCLASEEWTYRVHLQLLIWSCFSLSQRSFPFLWFLAHGRFDAELRVCSSASSSSCHSAHFCLCSQTFSSCGPPSWGQRTPADRLHGLTVGQSLVSKVRALCFVSFVLYLVHIGSRLGWGLHVLDAPLACLCRGLFSRNLPPILQIWLVPHQKERDGLLFFHPQDLLPENTREIFKVQVTLH